MDSNIYWSIHNSNASNARSIEIYFERHGKHLINSVIYSCTGTYSSTSHTPLTKAVQVGEKTIVDLLLRLGAKINYQISNAKTPLEEAISKEDVPMIKHLIEKGADVNFVNSSTKETPLVYAIKSKKIEIVKELIKSKANLNQIIENGKCPLITASSISEEMVNLLIANGADVNLIDFNKQTPLTYAIENGVWRFSQILLKYADIKLEDGEGKTPLWWAISQKVEEYIPWMLKHGANVTSGLITALEVDYPVDVFLQNKVDINESDINGKFPLLVAIEHNRYDSFLKLLTSKGLNINFIYPCGNTILGLCVKKNLMELVKHLLNLEANLLKFDKNGKVPLDWAVETNNLEMVKLLLQRGAHLSLPSAFLTAIKNKRLELVKYLKEQGASVNVVYKDNITPLLASLEIGDVEIIQYLVDNQADTSITATQVVSILIKWIEEKNLKVIEKIIEVVSANGLNTSANCGYTPLTKALEQEMYSITKLLVDNGADVNLANAKGEIPLSIAASNGDFRNVHLLIEHGADSNASLEELEALAKHDDNFAIYWKQLSRRKLYKVDPQSRTNSNFQRSGHEEA